ncbi:MAG TPA: hypothetical protein DEB25_09055 [Desulfobulbaceae bacterium]|nr:hypothetical protein [Desulfobulbaceae bacterium]
MTPSEAHKTGYDGMLVTLERIEAEKLADRLTIYRRGNVAIYYNELENGQWAREPEARAVVEAERNRPMNQQERKEYVQGYEKVIALMKARKADIRELWLVTALRHQTQNDQPDRDDNWER